MSDNRVPMAGDLYLHFKNKLYQIVTIAKHSETGEELVIYQALYGDYGVYARPLPMFTSEVDHEKYPDVKQKYRFQYITRNQLSNLSSETNQNDEKPYEVQINERIQRKAETQPRKILTDFLDAETAKEKLVLINQMRNSIDDFTLDSMAVCLDFVADGNTLEERFYSICKYLELKSTYENIRKN